MAGIKQNTAIVVAGSISVILIILAVIFAPVIRERLSNIGNDNWKRSVASLMVDPDSTKFRNTRKSTLGYCGEINSKNKFGGYVGFKRFHAYMGKSGKWSISLDTSIVDIFCQ